MEDTDISTDATDTATPAEPQPTATPSKPQSPIDQAMDAAKKVFATITGRAKS
jgi:hypothetical protein